MTAPRPPVAASVPPNVGTGKAGAAKAAPARCLRMPIGLAVAAEPRELRPDHRQRHLAARAGQAHVRRIGWRDDLRAGPGAAGFVHDADHGAQPADIPDAAQAPLKPEQAGAASGLPTAMR